MIKYCQECGASLCPNANYCQECGFKIIKYDQNQNSFFPKINPMTNKPLLRNLVT